MVRGRADSDSIYCRVWKMEQRMEQRMDSGGNCDVYPNCCAGLSVCGAVELCCVELCWGEMKGQCECTEVVLC